MNKLLIVHSGALGDFILALPAITALRRAYPQARIEILGQPAIIELARMAGCADGILSLERTGWHRLFAEGADLPEPLESTLTACDGIVSWFGSGDAAYRAALKARGARVIIAKGLPPPDKPQHAADYFVESVSPLLPAGFKIEDRIPRLPIPPAARQAVRPFLEEHGVAGKDKRLIAIHPGSGSLKKCWPAERFAELAGALGSLPDTNVLVIEGPADEAVINEFDKHRRGSPMIRVHRPLLTELSALLSWCDQYIGNDSGVTHLAAAVGTPVLALFGPTEPDIWGPRGAQVRILRRSLDHLTMQEVLERVKDGT